MKRTTRIALVGLAVATASVLAGCSSGGSSANQAEKDAQAQDQRTLLLAQPVPHFDWSQIRETLTSVQGAEANTVQTTTFFFQQGMSDPYFVCNSIGFPVASTTQLTNPVQSESHGQYGDGTVVVGQMDPTGVYSGDSAGTYVVCVNPDGKAEIQYAEPNVHTVGGPAAWDTAKHQIVLTGTATATVKTGK